MNNIFLFIVIGGVVLLFVVCLYFLCLCKTEEHRRYKRMMRERKTIRNWGIM